MKKPKSIILLLLLPTLLISSHASSFVFTGLQNTIASIGKTARRSDEAEETFGDHAMDESDEKMFDEAISDAEDRLDSALELDGMNLDKEYVVCVSDSQYFPLEEEDAQFKEAAIKLLRDDAQIMEALRYAADLDENPAFLYRELCSNFAEPAEQWVSTEDFAVEEGLSDHIAEMNDYAFCPKAIFPGDPTILNPSAWEIYSVYDEVNEKHEHPEWFEDEKGFIEDPDECEEDDGFKVLKCASAPFRTSIIKTSPGIVALSVTLGNLGLSTTAIATIRASFFSIRAAVRYWMPWMARVALIVAAVAALASVIVVYWAQVEAVIQAIVDTFVSVACSFASKVKAAFDSIIGQAERTATDPDLSLSIDGADYRFLALTDAAAEELARDYGDRIYHRAIRFSHRDNNFISSQMIEAGFDEQYVYITEHAYTKPEMADILTSIVPAIGSMDGISPEMTKICKQLYNSYVFEGQFAKEVLQEAFPTLYITGPNRHQRASPYALWHYHASRTPDGSNHLPVHSFFGGPNLAN